MTTAEFVRAVYQAGIPENLPIREFDRRVADLLKIDERTVRRYRLGVRTIPGPVRVALAALAIQDA